MDWQNKKVIDQEQNSEVEVTSNDNYECYQTLENKPFLNYRARF